VRLVGIQPGSLDGIPGYRTHNAIGRYEESSERAETGKLGSKLLRQLWGKAEVASFLPQIASHPDSKNEGRARETHAAALGFGYTVDTGCARQTLVNGDNAFGGLFGCP
jgi:hypothetical protein